VTLTGAGGIRLAPHTLEEKNMSSIFSELRKMEKSAEHSTFSVVF
jgi:hypothetical protein